MALVSVSAYARLHNVTKGAAQKWQARGLLKFIDGKVETDASDRALLHAGLGRFTAGGQGSRSKPATGSQVAEPVATGPVAETPLAPQLQAAEAEALEQTGDLGSDQALVIFAQKLLSGSYSNLIIAQTVKENALALLRVLEFRKKANELVEIADAETVLFEASRQARDAWLSFPSRVGPMLAADLGLEADAVVEALTAHVHQQLADMGEPDNPFGEDRPTEAGGATRMDAATTPERSGLGGSLPEAGEGGWE